MTVGAETITTCGVCLVGPHRGDLELLLGHGSARDSFARDSGKRRGHGRWRRCEAVAEPFVLLVRISDLSSALLADWM
jgi:hypothetical protein